MEQAGRSDVQQLLVMLLDEVVSRARAKGMSQADLARIAGLPPERVSRIKNTGRCEFDTLARLIDAADLEVTLVPKGDYATRLSKGLF